MFKIKIKNIQEVIIYLVVL